MEPIESMNSCPLIIEDFRVFEMARIRQSASQDTFRIERTTLEGCNDLPATDAVDRLPLAIRFSRSPLPMTYGAAFPASSTFLAFPVFGVLRVFALALLEVAATEPQHHVISPGKMGALLELIACWKAEICLSY